MSYTKGPWKVGENLNNKLAVASGNKVICVMPVMFVSADEKKANARLIASAPELLEALKYIASRSQLCLDSPSIVLDEMSCELIRNAIAKAEGTE